MRNKSLILLAITISGCAMQRAQVASDARAQMVGLSREKVLGCMGPPANKAAEGGTEVWSYPSGNNHRATFATASSSTTADATRYGNTVSGSASTVGSGVAVSTSRYCVVQVVMTGGAVSRVNYQGPTGGILSAGEQCAFAVQNCVKQ